MTKKIRPPIDPIDAKALDAYLTARDDFQFEREVFAEAIKLNLNAEHAGSYIDPIKGVPRQFDIRVSHTIGNHTLNLAIECKQLICPLLVSRVPRTSDESYTDVMHSPPPSHVGGGAECERIRAGLYRTGESVGKDMRQIKRDDKNDLIPAGDETYDKWTQAFASLGVMIEKASEKLRPRRDPTNFDGFLPVLVVPDSTLWVVDYSAHGARLGDPRPAAEVEFYIGRQYQPASGPQLSVSHLHILARSAVESFLQTVANAGGLWLTMFGRQG